MATGALINAVWDLWAKREGKPMWKLLADLTPEQIVAAIDFTYITDVLTPDEALEMLHQQKPGKAEREAEMRRDGFPAYTTSTSWLGYPDDKVRRLCREAKAQGWTAFKMKVGLNLEDNIKRAALMREEIGNELRLMMDANQCWDVGEAIRQIKELARFDPWWIEEPTSPDDVLGHAAIARAVAPIGLPEPRPLQAVPSGGCDPLPAGRQLPDGRSQRSPGGPVDGGEVRRAGLPACRWRRPLRVRPAHLDLRLHRHQRQPGEPDV